MGAFPGSAVDERMYLQLVPGEECFILPIDLASINFSLAHFFVHFVKAQTKLMFGIRPLPSLQRAASNSALRSDSVHKMEPIAAKVLRGSRSCPPGSFRAPSAECANDHDSHARDGSFFSAIHDHVKAMAHHRSFVTNTSGFLQEFERFGKEQASQEAAGKHEPLVLRGSWYVVSHQQGSFSPPWLLRKRLQRKS